MHKVENIIRPVQWSDSAINKVMFSLLIDTKSHLDLQSLYSQDTTKHKIYSELENSNYISQGEFDIHLTNTKPLIDIVKSSPKYKSIQDQCSSLSCFLKSNQPELQYITDKPTIVQLNLLQNYLDFIKYNVNPKLNNFLNYALKSTNFDYSPHRSTRIKSMGGCITKSVECEMTKQVGDLLNMF
jgi:hypothetical protein